MKKRKLNSIYKYVLGTLLILLLLNSVFAQTIDKTISKTAEFASDVIIEVKGSSCDVDINTWDKSQLKVDYVIQVDAKTDADINAFYRTLEAAISDQIKVKSGSITISLPFKKLQQNRQKIEIEFFGSSEIYYLTKFDASIVVHAPKQNNLKVLSSFSKLNIDNINADANITVSSGQLEMGDCKNLKLNASFTKNIKIGNVENAELKISSSDLEMGEIKNDLKLRCSFSGIKIAEIGNKADLNLSSSTFETSDIKELDLSGSFVRRFKIRNVDMANIKLSSSEFESMMINTLNIHSISFSTLRIDEVQKLIAPGSSSSKFYIKKANSIEVTNSSFSDFYINFLKNSFSTKASSGSIHLINVANGFDKIDIDGQFVSIDINVEANADYLISADLEFPNYNFKEITFQNRNKDMSKEVIYGWKGSNKNASSKISFNCKSCNIRLN